MAAVALPHAQLSRHLNDTKRTSVDAGLLTHKLALIQRSQADLQGLRRGSLDPLSVALATPSRRGSKASIVPLGKENAPITSTVEAYVPSAAARQFLATTVNNRQPSFRKSSLAFNPSRRGSAVPVVPEADVPVRPTLDRRQSSQQTIINDPLVTNIKISTEARVTLQQLDSYQAEAIVSRRGSVVGPLSPTVRAPSGDAFGTRRLSLGKRQDSALSTLSTTSTTTITPKRPGYRPGDAARRRSSMQVQPSTAHLGAGGDENRAIGEMSCRGTISLPPLDTLPQQFPSGSSPTSPTRTGDDIHSRRSSLASAMSGYSGHGGAAPRSPARPSLQRAKNDRPNWTQESMDRGAMRSLLDFSFNGSNSSFGGQSAARRSSATNMEASAKRVNENSELEALPRFAGASAAAYKPRAASASSGLPAVGEEPDTGIKKKWRVKALFGSR